MLQRIKTGRVNRAVIPSRSLPRNGSRILRWWARNDRSIDRRRYYASLSRESISREPFFEDAGLDISRPRSTPRRTLGCNLDQPTVVIPLMVSRAQCIRPRDTYVMHFADAVRSSRIARGGRRIKGHKI